MDAPPTWLLIASLISLVLYRLPTWRLRYYRRRAKELQAISKALDQDLEELNRDRLDYWGSIQAP